MEQTPEGVMLEQALKRTHISVRKASATAEMSEGRWRQIVKGYQAVSADTKVPVVAPAATLARMALAVGLGSEDLMQAGREDAAEALEDFQALDAAPRRQAMLTRLGHLARQRREEKGLSRNLVASESGVKSETTIQNFEYGKTLPMPIYQKALEEVLEWKSGIIEKLMASDVDPGDVTPETLDMPLRDERAGVVPGPLRDASLDELLGEIRRRVTGASMARVGDAPSDQDEVMLAARELIRDTKRRKGAGKTKDLGDSPGKPAS